MPVPKLPDSDSLPPAFEPLILHLRRLPDPRQPGKVRFRLDEILLVLLCAALSGTTDFTEVARFGEKRLDWLRRLLPFERGVPAHDTYRRLCALLDPVAFVAALTAWAEQLARRLARDSEAGRRLVAGWSPSRAWPSASRRSKTTTTRAAPCPPSSTCLT